MEWLYLLSVVDSLVALTMWNKVFAEYKRTCTGVCYRVSVACDYTSKRKVSQSFETHTY